MGEGSCRLEEGESILAEEESRRAEAAGCRQAVGAQVEACDREGCRQVAACDR